MKFLMRLLFLLAGLALFAPSALAQDDGSDLSEDALVPFDETITDDLIVEGSICSSDGDECANGESFTSPSGASGFRSEYKAKDNSPAISFETTDVNDADWVIGATNDDLRFEWDRDDGSDGRLLVLRAPSSTLPARAGLNISSPDAALHVGGADTPSGATEQVFILESDVAPQQVFTNASTGETWFFAMTSDDEFKISRAGTGAVEAKFFESGDLALAGTLIQGSDATNKANFAAVDAAAVLDTIVGLDITEWNYIGDDARHVGPTAQDFAAAFGLGNTDTGIAAVDADGVALAAIQALAIENDELRAQVATLEAPTNTSGASTAQWIAIAVALALAVGNWFRPRKLRVAN